jgi:hypothetical protein
MTLLVSAQHHRVSMIAPEFFASEIAYCAAHLFRRRSGRHGKDDLVDELGRLPPIDREQLVSLAIFLQIQVPIVDELLPCVLAEQPITIVCLDLQLARSADVIEVCIDPAACTRALAAGHLDHHFRCPRDRSTNLLDLREGQSIPRASATVAADIE